MNCLRTMPCPACAGTGVGQDCPACSECLGAGLVYVTVSSTSARDPQPARVGGREAHG